MCRNISLERDEEIKFGKRTGKLSRLDKARNQCWKANQESKVSKPNRQATKQSRQANEEGKSNENKL